ncbi:MAG: prepilin-type N-terminal cleavage/methylation domain-containing protein, partial [Candidatus Pacebacteria bacterium]|nr:prepilin-type N-terminal cleavage/methylation domain-containing protein [Candidatus Paceibacterota bacterium]
MDKKIIELKNIKNSTKNFFSKEIFKGFTLVELLVVISIVAVIVSVTVVFLGQTRASARDGKRQTEMHTLETTLQQYHSDHGNYPKEETGIIVEEQYQDEAGTFYMEMKDEYLTSSPKDPLYASGKTYVDAEGIDRDYGYRYVTNDDGSEYALFNGLETSGDYIESYSSGSAGETIGWEGVPATPPSPPTGFSSPG